MSTYKPAEKEEVPSVSSTQFGGGRYKARDKDRVDLTEINKPFLGIILLHQDLHLDLVRRKETYCTSNHPLLP